MTISFLKENASLLMTFLLSNNNYYYNELTDIKYIFNVVCTVVASRRLYACSSPLPPMAHTRIFL